MIRRDFAGASSSPREGASTFERLRCARRRGQRARRARCSGSSPTARRGRTRDVGGRDTFPPTDPADFAAYARDRRDALPRQGRRVGDLERAEQRLSLLEADAERRSRGVRDAAHARARRRRGGLARDAGPARRHRVHAAAHRGRDPVARGGLRGVTGPRALFDVAGIHTYALYPPQRAPELGELADPPLDAKLQMHAWLLAQHGGERQADVDHRAGLARLRRGRSRGQARLTTRATILAARAGASAIFWYTLRDGPHPDAVPARGRVRPRRQRSRIPMPARRRRPSPSTSRSARCSASSVSDGRPR